MIDPALHATLRFGLGPAGAEPLPKDPKAWLTAQLDQPDTADFSALPNAAQALDLLKQDREARQRGATPQEANHPILEAWVADAASQLMQALTGPAPFRERLVWFWANHFTVSQRRGADAPLIGPFIREAIRPHVTGTFHDMLLAVMRHPAMLLYLDNAGSAGPNSPAGQRRAIGLNENLARESLELHTVTPRAGFTQADVQAYAALLTGWSVEQQTPPLGYRFRPALHEPGPKRLLGQSFPPGEQGGLDALRFLATHPATCDALARKLACHFIADSPPEDAVRRIAATLASTGGSLRAAYQTLIDTPAAWQPHTKLRTPFDYTIAVLRAVGVLPTDGRNLVGVLHLLGQPVWNAPLPNGWPDTAAAWLDPETLLRRADWVYRLTGRLGAADPEGLAAPFAPLLRPATLHALATAPDRRTAQVLLFTAPEFQWR